MKCPVFELVCFTKVAVCVFQGSWKSFSERTWFSCDAQIDLLSSECTELNQIQKIAIYEKECIVLHKSLIMRLLDSQKLIRMTQMYLFLSIFKSKSMRMCGNNKVILCFMVWLQLQTIAKKAFFHSVIRSRPSGWTSSLFLE